MANLGQVASVDLEVCAVRLALPTLHIPLRMRASALGMQRKRRQTLR
jgi:hypothetical protein